MCRIESLLNIRISHEQCQLPLYDVEKQVCTRAGPLGRYLSDEQLCIKYEVTYPALSFPLFLPWSQYLMKCSIEASWMQWLDKFQMIQSSICYIDIGSLTQLVIDSAVSVSASLLPLWGLFVASRCILHLRHQPDKHEEPWLNPLYWQAHSPLEARVGESVLVLVPSESWVTLGEATSLFATVAFGWNV